MINAGLPPVVEPGLEELLARVVPHRTPAGHHIDGEAVRRTDLALICVGTPEPAHRSARDRAPSRASARRSAGRRGRTRPLHVSCCAARSLPGTTERVLLPALARGAGRSLEGALGIAVNPEFMREGSSLDDFVHPPFTLVGSADRETPPCCARSTPASTRPSFRPASDRGDGEVRRQRLSRPQGLLRQRDRRPLRSAGRRRAGGDADLPRWTGSSTCRRPICARASPLADRVLPKDLRALLYAARAADASRRRSCRRSSLPTRARFATRSRPCSMTRRRRVGVVGLAFKPGTDDLRESPMVTLVETLIGKGCRRADPRPGGVRRAIRRRQPALHRGGDPAHLVADVRRRASPDRPRRGACHRKRGRVAGRVLAGARPDQVIVDLTRGAAQAREAVGVEA